ncbi:hypothetical protein R6Q57_020495 [Mikania cordata]
MRGSGVFSVGFPPGVVVVAHGRPRLWVQNSPVPKNGSKEGQKVFPVEFPSVVVVVPYRRFKTESRIESNPNIEEQKPFPTTIPKKPRRGRRSEAVAIEDFMRSSLEETFAAIREQNSEVLNGSEGVIRDKVHDDDEDEDYDKKKKKGMVVEEEDPDWAVDAEIGWGIGASEYFQKHPIKNVIGEDGVEIDWEGELDDNLVKEINY